MILTREQVKETLKTAQGQMMAMFAKEKEGRVLLGESMSLTVNQKRRELMAYGNSSEMAPVYFDIHGGGYAWGTISDGDAWCSLLCRELSMHVYSLDYPLVPEAEFPDQLLYVYQTISYMRDHAEEYGIMPDCIYIGGRSAGANLAAALCLYAKRQGEFQFQCQVLDHPWLDLCGLISWEERYRGKEALGQEIMEGLALGYADVPNQKKSLVSPLNATDEELCGLPPAVIQTCELDSLELEGRLYAKRLEQNGVPVIYHCMPKAIHGFTESDTPMGDLGRQWLLQSFQAMRNLSKANID